MKRNGLNYQSVKASTTDLSILARTFIYIYIRILETAEDVGGRSIGWVNLEPSILEMARELERLDVISLNSDDYTPTVNDYFAHPTDKGKKLIARYFEAAASELKSGRFGKYKLDHNYRYYIDILARLA